MRIPGSPEDRLKAWVAAQQENVTFRRADDRPPDLPPLSKRLTDLIAPYRSEADTLDAYRALTAIAVFSWNLSLQPDSEHERYLDKAALLGNVPDPDTFRSIVRDLIRRKRRLFPDDARLIAGHEVTPTSKGFHLVVASTNLAEP